MPANASSHAGSRWMCAETAGSSPVSGRSAGSQCGLSRKRMSNTRSASGGIPRANPKLENEISAVRIGNGKESIVLKNGTTDSRKSWFAVGAYKKLPNTIGEQETTPPKQVSAAIRALLSWYKAIEHLDGPLLTIALVILGIGTATVTPAAAHVMPMMLWPCVGVFSMRMLSMIAPLSAFCVSSCATLSVTVTVSATAPKVSVKFTVGLVAVATSTSGCTDF